MTKVNGYVYFYILLHKYSTISNNQVYLCKTFRNCRLCEFTKKNNQDLFIGTQSRNGDRRAGRVRYENAMPRLEKTKDPLIQITFNY
ncbi:hypothetical protein T07_7276 [Trichinella nelsoni]|uniref:Uncharacterized protein n=1 Tax=Trichinella nelsoni TaxID=6336 RepID=A0A0V0RLC2_9BILA|nr:hypothetical protein T07_7276 [Trichinella nelsoni]